MTGPSLAIGFQIYNQARIQEINDWRERLEFVAIRMRICIRQANDGEAGPWGPGMNFRVYGRESQRRFLNGQ